MLNVSESLWNVGNGVMPIFGRLGLIHAGGKGLCKHALKFSQTEGIEI
jgi:hypothetical protein